jgi:anti-sigma-K factor RskA
MTPEELQELCALYVLGALEPQEAASIENRLQTEDPEVVRTVAELRDVVNLLPYALPQVPPDPRVRARLLEQLQISGREERRRQDKRALWRLSAWFHRPLVWAPAAAATVLALVFGWQVHNLRLQIADLQAEVRRLRDTAEERERLVALLTTPSVTSIVLSGTEHAPNARARVLWQPHRGELTVVTYGLPPLPPGKAYQLWGLTAGKPLPFDTFHSDSHGVGTIQARLRPGQVILSGAAVSLEPEAGVPQPTGQIVLLGTF